MVQLFGLWYGLVIWTADGLVIWTDGAVIWTDVQCSYLD